MDAGEKNVTAKAISLQFVGNKTTTAAAAAVEKCSIGGWYLRTYIHTEKI